MHIQNKAVPLQPQLRTRSRAFSSAGSEHLPYKQRVGGSNPSTPTPNFFSFFNWLLGRLAQLVQSICLTSRGSAVRIRQRPLPKSINGQIFPFGAFSSAGSEHLPYKQRVGGSNPSTPTKLNIDFGRLAQLVQSICLTSRGSAVRIRQRPHEQKSPMRLITKEIIIGYELMRFASARPFLSNGSYLSLFKCK